jgi:hypothetical protein
LLSDPKLRVIFDVVGLLRYPEIHRWRGGKLQTPTPVAAEASWMGQRVLEIYSDYTASWRKQELRCPRCDRMGVRLGIRLETRMETQLETQLETRLEA